MALPPLPLDPQLLWTTSTTTTTVALTSFEPVDFDDPNCTELTSSPLEPDDLSTTFTTSEHPLRARHQTHQHIFSPCSPCKSHHQHYYKQQKLLPTTLNTRFCYKLLLTPFYTAQHFPTTPDYFSPLFSFKQKSFVCLFHLFLLLLILSQNIQLTSAGGSSAGIEKKTVAKIGAIFREAPNQGGGIKSSFSSPAFSNFPLGSPTSNYLSGVGVSGSGGGSRIHEDDLEAEIAFRYAVQRINRDRNILPNTTLVYDIAYVGKDDSFHAAKRACNLINKGALAIFGPNDDRIGVHVQSVCDAVDIPHLESRLHNLNSGKEFSINLHPGAFSKAQSLRVLIAYLNWTQIGVIYEDDINLIGLQELVKLPLSKSTQFIYRKTSPEHFRETLIDLRDRGIYTMIVDTRPESLTSFFTAILQVQMNENRYHYHFTTFDLEIYDLEDFMYNDVNITTFRIVDYGNPIVKNIIKELEKYHVNVAKQLLHRGGLMKAASAIIFDSVYAFARGLHQFQKNPHQQKSPYHHHSYPSSMDSSSSMALLSSKQSSGLGVDAVNPALLNPPYSFDGIQLPGPGPGDPSAVSSIFGSIFGSSSSSSSAAAASSRPPPLLNSSASCSNETPWTSGLSLYNYIDSLSFQGLTGRVSFKEGTRANMKLELLKLRNYRLEKVGEWYASESLLNITNQEAFNQYKAKNTTLRVTVVLMEPYIRRVRNNSSGPPSISFSGGSDIGALPLSSSSSSASSSADQPYYERDSSARYEGFCIDLLNAIAKALHFNYEIYEVEDNRFGAQDETTGEWRGLVRELIDKKADLAIAPLTINFARENVIDFTKPFMNLGISILFKMPTSTPTRLFSFMSPLAFDIWLYVVAAYVLVSATLFIVARFSPYEWTNPHPCNRDFDIKENQFNLADSFWFTVVTLMKQGCDMNPKSFSTRIIGAIWWFFTLILISSYTANLAAFLTVERISTPIESVEDLAGQSKIKYGTLKDGSTMNFFRDSKFPTFKTMWEFMKKNEDSFSNSYEEGRDRVLKGDYAFLMESTMIDYMVQRDCNLMQIGPPMNSNGYGIATPMGSEWKDKISLEILELQEKGEIQMMYDKWWKSPGLTCIRDELKNKDGKASPLGLDNIGGVFVVLMFGLVLAMIASFLEFLSGKKQHQQQMEQLQGMAHYHQHGHQKVAVHHGHSGHHGHLHQRHQAHRRSTETDESIAIDGGGASGDCRGGGGYANSDGNSSQVGIY